MRPLHAVEPTAREGVASSDFPTSPDSLRAARSAQATQALLAERDADRKGDQGERGGAAAKSESVVRHVRVPRRSVRQRKREAAGERLPTAARCTEHHIRSSSS
jgi:hypothetical protein